MKFAYKAKKGPEDIITGDIAASSVQDAVSRLSAQGLFVISIAPEGRRFIFPRKSTRRMTLAARIEFTHRLLDYLEADVELIDALENIIEDNSSGEAAEIVSSIKDAVKNGASLSWAMKKHDQMFDPLYTALIQSGERAGNIVPVLRGILDYLNNRDFFHRTIQDALIYPLFLAGVSACGIVVMLTVAVPRITGIFLTMGRQLPLVTRILIFISEKISFFLLLTLIAAVMLALLYKRLMMYDLFKRTRDRFFLSLPLVGEYLRLSDVARFLRTMGVLTGNGVGILEAVRMSHNVAVNNVIRMEIRTFTRALEQGQGLYACMQRSALFKNPYLSVIKAGEGTGRFHIACTKASAALEKKLTLSVRSFAKLFEPLVILVVGLIISFIVIAVLLPVLSINSFI